MLRTQIVHKVGCSHCDVTHWFVGKVRYHLGPLKLDMAIFEKIIKLIT